MPSNFSAVKDQNFSFFYASRKKPFSNDFLVKNGVTTAHFFFYFYEILCYYKRQHHLPLIKLNFNRTFRPWSFDLEFLNGKIIIFVYNLERLLVTDSKANLPRVLFSNIWVLFRSFLDHLYELYLRHEHLLSWWIKCGLNFVFQLVLTNRKLRSILILLDKTLIHVFRSWLGH